MSLQPLVGLELEYALVVGADTDWSSQTACERLVEAVVGALNGDGRTRCVPTGHSAARHDCMLDNGARLYIDLQHPEYSTPIVADAFQAVIAERAGEELLTNALHNARCRWPELKSTRLYKDSADRAGESYAYHENYLVSPSVFDQLTRQSELATKSWLPYLATRPIFAGAGFLVGDGQPGKKGFYLSPRALFIERLASLETTHRRGMMNTRDRPYADPDRFRRLHVIVGEANRSAYSTFLKVGVTQLVLRMIEHGALRGDRSLANPLEALWAVSRARDKSKLLNLKNGQRWTARDIQLDILAEAQRFLEVEGADEATQTAVRFWEETLEDLADWSDVPFRTRRRLDWLIKRSIFEAIETEADWDLWDPRLVQLEDAYHRLDDDRIFSQLRDAGVVESFPVEAAHVAAALSQPPGATRAALRAARIAEKGQAIAWANWTTIAYHDGRKDEFSDPTKGPAK